MFTANGVYVLVDYHPHKLENTVHESADSAQQWAKVWQRIACLPNFQVRHSMAMQQRMSSFGKHAYQGLRVWQHIACLPKSRHAAHGGSVKGSMCVERARRCSVRRSGIALPACPNSTRNMRPG